MSSRCELPAQNSTPEGIRDTLKSARRIAIVGHSASAGLRVVVSRCMMRDHRALIGN